MSDVYQVIGDYLKNSGDFSKYLTKREVEATELLAAHPDWSPPGLRGRLLARRKMQ